MIPHYTPIATIALDHQQAAGTIRGVVAWDHDRHLIAVLDPIGDEPQVPADCAEGSILSIDDALSYVEASWGRNNAAWDLSWLVEDTEDWPAWAPEVEAD